MRKITQDAAQAFQNGTPFKSGNTEIKTGLNGDVFMFLHGHCIADKLDNVLTIDACGYLTATTKDRLNGINGVSVNQSKHQWFLNGREWNGDRVEVKA
jgi:hypothetical protein